MCAFRLGIAIWIAVHLQHLEKHTDCNRHSTPWTDDRVVFPLHISYNSPHGVSMCWGHTAMYSESVSNLVPINLCALMIWEPAQNPACEIMRKSICMCSQTNHSVTRKEHKLCTRHSPKNYVLRMEPWEALQIEQTEEWIINLNYPQKKDNRQRLGDFFFFFLFF